jgi:hypothetical protein
MYIGVNIYFYIKNFKNHFILRGPGWLYELGSWIT